MERVEETIPIGVAKSLLAFAVATVIPAEVSWEWRAVMAMTVTHSKLQWDRATVVMMVLRFLCGFIPVYGVWVTLFLFTVSREWSDSIPFIMASVTVACTHFIARLTLPSEWFLGGAVIYMVFCLVLAVVFNGSIHQKFALQIMIGVSVRSLGFSAPSVLGGALVFLVYTLFQCLVFRGDPVRGRPFTAMIEIACAAAMNTDTDGILRLAKWPVATALDMVHQAIILRNPDVEFTDISYTTELLYCTLTFAYAWLFAWNK